MDIQEQRQGSVMILKPAGRLDSLSCRNLKPGCWRRDEE